MRHVTRFLALALLFLSVVAVLPTSAPVSVGYVYSDSMEPTVPEGGGYVLVPAGEVQEGDVVTFYAPTREKYVTHRVVGETASGFVTKGDNNPSTDQAGRLPPVERSQIVGEVLTVGETPLVVPHLQTAVELLRSYWFVVLGAALAYLLAGDAAATSRRRTRDVVTVRDVVTPVLVVGVVVSVAVLSLGATHETMRYGVSPTPDGDPTTLTAGETETRVQRVGLPASVVTESVVAVDGGRIVDREQVDTSPMVGPLSGVLSRRTIDITVRFPAATDDETVRATVSVYTVLRTLPRGVLEALAAVHPLLAVLGSVLAGFVPVVALRRLLVDDRAPVRLPRARWFHGGKR